MQQFGAMGRVDDFGVIHQAVETAFVVGNGSERGALGGRDGLETRRRGVDAVAVAHPHLLFRADGPDAMEKFAILPDVNKGAAEFPMIG